ncbi:hypothetical protein WEH80_18915 [Actinomycetes bacterium KLBMP 9759]
MADRDVDSETDHGRRRGSARHVDNGRYRAVLRFEAMDAERWLFLLVVHDRRWFTEARPRHLVLVIAASAKRFARPGPITEVDVLVLGGRDADAAVGVDDQSSESWPAVDLILIELVGDELGVRVERRRRQPRSRDSSREPRRYPPPWRSSPRRRRDGRGD